MMMRNTRYTLSLTSLLVLFFLFSFVKADAATPDEIEEKKLELAMRMIGDKVLSSIGDSTSRVLPIEVEEKKYRISFENDFGIEPGIIVSVVNQVLREADITLDLLVEVYQCATKDVVHGFVVSGRSKTDMTPCRQRELPVDCYGILITVVNEDLYDDENSGAISNNDTGQNEHSPLRPVWMALPLMLSVGLLGFYLSKKVDGQKMSSDIVRIGNTRFDKKNMSLLYGQQKTELSNKETDLLSLLQKSINSPIEREVILERVWGDEGDYVGRTLDVYISKLRKKLIADPSIKIINIRGVGYKLIVE